MTVLIRKSLSNENVSDDDSSRARDNRKETGRRGGSGDARVAA